MTASEFNLTTVGLGLLAGLVLFLYSVDRLAEGLRAVTGERMKSILSRRTATPLAVVAIGAVATTILASSPVTIITVIALVSAGLLSYEQNAAGCPPALIGWKTPDTPGYWIASVVMDKSIAPGEMFD